jgi:hypothetical protein
VRLESGFAIALDDLQASRVPPPWLLQSREAAVVRGAGPTASGRAPSSARTRISPISAIRDPEGNTITFIGDFRVEY